jgi:hypothetical protein
VPEAPCAGLGARGRARALPIARGVIPPGRRWAGADATTVAALDGALAAAGRAAGYRRLLGVADVLSRFVRGASLARLDGDEAGRMLGRWMASRGLRRRLAIALTLPVKDAFYARDPGAHALAMTAPLLIGHDLVERTDAP